MPKETIQKAKVYTVDETGGALEYDIVNLQWGDYEVILETIQSGQHHNMMLNREEINSLIKALRRARDRTFGKDE